MKRSKALVLLALSLFSASAVQATAYPVDQSQRPAPQMPRTAGVKLPLAYKAGDLTAVVGGKTKMEYQHGKNVILLNDSLPDDFGFFRHLSDIYLDIAYGEEQYGHKAIEMFVDFRQRSLWGDAGKFVQTEGSTVKVSDSVVSGHNHKIPRPLVWMRDMWLSASLNAILGLDMSTTHFIKGGLFPFWIGRGISLGAFFGASKSHLALYSGQNDQSAPGILISGDILKDRLAYDLYYSKFEENSASLNDTFNHVKANHVNRRNTPWRGVAKDNELWAARLKWHAMKGDEDSVDMMIEPYVLYNEASDQKVEFEADAKSELGTAGVGLEMSYKNFELGGEVAFNFGQEKLRCIDRNVVAVQRQEAISKDPLMFTPVAGDEGDLREVFSKVFLVTQANPLITAPLPATAENRAAIDANQNAINGEVFAGNGGNYVNAADRFRNAYENNYRGWMGVVDASYLWQDWDLKFAFALGFASGDADPHANECNKNYKGFVGINEGYSGTRVQSFMILDARKLKRPLFIDNETTEAEDDNSFTDLQFVGAGFTWTPIEHNAKKFSINPNVLFYWKDHPDCKIDCKTGATLDEKADKYLGFELNILGNYELLKDLQFIGKAGAFFPGSYYRDVKGLTLNSQPFTKLDRVDSTGFNSPNYGLSDDVAFYFNMGVEFAF